MRRHTAVALLIGLVITLGATLLQWTRVWEPLERQTIDWRFAAIPRPDRVLNESIRFVDIDDGAMDSIGAWPWKRSVFATAIEELRRAGASTIALDILFEEPQEPTIDASGRRIDHDSVLASAFASVPVVLAVRIGEDAAFAEWTSDVNSPTSRLLDAITADVTKDPTVLADQLDLPEELRSRLATRPMQFKQIAVWRKLYSLLSQNQLPETLEQLEALVAPTVDSNTGQYDIRRRLHGLLDQFHAWRALTKYALPGRTTRSSHVVAPLRVLAEQAAMTGVVNPELDVDGNQRLIRPVWPTPVGICLQFGIASAARYRGIPLSQIDLLGEQIGIGSRFWDLDDGQIWLDWPTSGWSWEEESRDGRARRISIGFLVSLAEQREIQTQNESQLNAVALEIAEILQLNLLRGDDGIPLLDEDLLTEIRDEATFQMDSFRSSAAEISPTQEELDQVAPYKNFLDLYASIARGREIIHSAEQILTSFEGKLVFIGWTATGALADFVGTPLHPRTPGVMVHAVMADMMLSGHAMNRPRATIESGLLVAMGLIGSLIAARLGSIWSFLALAASLSAYFVGACWVFAYASLLAPMVGPLGTALVAWLGATSYVAGVHQRERQRITRQFRSRVSAQLVDHLVHNPNSVNVAGAQREMTVIFADLAGFTTIAENLGGPATVSTLNRFMSGLTDVVVAHGAYMNKFLGDGFLAFWSAFVPDPSQAASACTAAVRCQDVVRKLNADLRDSIGTSLSLRVGIATGVVVVGDCGAPPALNDYTVIGDSVNLAARLESANKQFGSRILIDGRTRELAGLSAERFVGLGRVVVVGQSTPIELYGEFGDECDPEIFTLISSAVRAFTEKRQEDARTQWIDVRDRSASLNKLCETYLAALRAETLDGILRLGVK